MGFQGINYSSINKKAVRSLNGFYGIKIRLDITPVKVTDFRGLGLSNVKLEAANQSSGVAFAGFTDSNGTVFMQLDPSTNIKLTKDGITKTVQYNGQATITYQIDLPFIQNN